VTQKPPSVYLVDDQAIVRASFRAMLDGSKQFAVIGQQGDARAGIAEIRRLQPDVVLLDISMPGLSGLEALPQIKAVLPRGIVVMVTDFENAAYVREALRGGARGYLSKADEPGELLDGLTRIIAGEQVVSQRIPGFHPS
jgi:DNA-binding NarL/FixJ family response regulator